MTQTLALLNLPPAEPGVLHDLSNQKESAILEGHLILDHIHMCISIPPKYLVSHVVGFIKGKNAIAIAHQLGRGRNFTGESFWAHGYFVSTVGLDEEMVRRTFRIRKRKMNVMIS
jgi:putative transposase